PHRHIKPCQKTPAIPTPGTWLQLARKMPTLPDWPHASDLLREHLPGPQPIHRYQSLARGRVPLPSRWPVPSTWEPTEEKRKRFRHVCENVRNDQQPAQRTLVSKSRLRIRQHRVAARQRLQKPCEPQPSTVDPRQQMPQSSMTPSDRPTARWSPFHPKV